MQEAKRCERYTREIEMHKRESWRDIRETKLDRRGGECERDIRDRKI
jgi:hypothetical protein